MIMSWYGVIQMYSYEGISHVLGYETGQMKKITWDNLMVPFMVGGSARFIASSFFYPLDSVRIRLQMKTYTRSEMKEKRLKTRDTNMRKDIQYKGLRDAFKKIYRNEGIKGFYKGLTPTLIKIFPTSGLFFLSYELTLSYL